MELRSSGITPLVRPVLSDLSSNSNLIIGIHLGHHSLFQEIKGQDL